ncbi:GNAT family N-acetyltransferase [Stenotrophomonas sp.]|uniref:GNAT family N-acetyltransferase n=1 Tax=Stenotrophomonas sp. TaxID=69392 RepID=UPI0028AB473C|nr:GNAT family N-acetyltransferase [Stenotrophomonas sp.]
MRLTAPAALTAGHRLERFICSAPDLSKWLIERAYQNQASGASRCFVTCDEQGGVVGYYALAAGSMSHQTAPGRVRRNMPNPIPVIVLGRLAVHKDWAGQGVGQGLLKDAVMRAVQASRQIGARALLCHAIDDTAKAFYLKHGFIASPIDDLTIMLSLNHS